MKSPRDAFAELGDYLGVFYKGLIAHGMYEEVAEDLTQELLHIIASKIMEVEGD